MTSFIPGAGEEASFALGRGCNNNNKSSGLTVRHGSSLSLMSNVCEFLANPIQEDTFNYIDPTADHFKWARKGLSLYYACVSTNDGTMVCALRAATESESNNHGDGRRRPPIFLIDYVYSAPSHRDQGIAGMLIREILNLALADIKFVLSIEESCVYWLEKHKFFLCENQILKDRLNVFPDTHLLIHQDSQKDMETLVQDLQKTRQQTDSHSRSRSTSPITATTKATTVPPPQSFVNCLNDLRIFGTSQDGLPLCLRTLATLLKNAKNDTSDDGKRQTIRINNPQVHRRVFAVGGEPAMKLLQECGFELQVNEDGDAILQFATTGPHLQWLDAAIAQLDHHQHTF